ncbi:MAG: cytochrome c oxidase subunit II [Acidothermus cellulolyticus]|nr:cytochrome c oxidase subunit II [Acidothermus cellulolyticus]
MRGSALSARHDGGTAKTAHRRRSVAVRIGLLVALVGLTSGCTANDLPRLGMPTPITAQAQRVLRLWQGGWAAALFVGCIVWGLIIWCVIAYRKRDGAQAPQTTYNVPIEVLYTVVPVIFVAVFFYFTARDENYVTKLSAHPDVTVEVVGYQWDWQFNYLSGPQPDAPIVAQVTGDAAHGHPATLELPAGETVRFKLVSPDVIHAFWVPNFLFKRDVIPGRMSEFDVHIDADKQGTYIGRCTELCGLYHDQMIFYVKVVDPVTYQHDLETMKAQYAAGGAS